LKEKRSGVQTEAGQASAATQQVLTAIRALIGCPDLDLEHSVAKINRGRP
jgi:hypothetical protein